MQFFGLSAQKSILHACQFKGTSKLDAHKYQVAFELYYMYLTVITMCKLFMISATVHISELLVNGFCHVCESAYLRKHRTSKMLSEFHYLQKCLQLKLAKIVLP